MEILISLLGIVTLLGIAFLLSDNKKAINPRTVAGAFLLQAGLGAFALYFDAGRTAIEALASGVSKLFSYADAGIGFLFGSLINPGAGDWGFLFAIKVLPVIIFFSSLIAVLYHLGIMQLVIRVIGGGIQKLLGTSRSESLSATANVFVGQTEAPLLVRPFISRMTQSELFAIMVGGLASVAGTVLFGYVSMGGDLKFLLAACFMSAPGGLLMAKIIKPEVEEPHQDIQSAIDDDPDQPVNVIDAAAVGASNGLKLCVNVGAMLIAFISLIAVLNGITGGVGEIFGLPDLTIEKILGWVFYPIAFIIGTPAADITQVASLIGQKIIANEFVAFMSYGELIKTGGLTEQGQVIANFALCGFANLSSIAILLGGLGAMAPNRRPDIARLGLKAVAAGTLSNLMSATLAGLFFML